MTIDEVIRLALQHQKAGRLSEAEAIYRQVLAQQPDQPDALHLLGMVAAGIGRHDVAVDLIGRAIAAYPTAADYHFNLGVALDRLGRGEEAISAYRRTIALNPNMAAAYNNLGVSLRKVRQADEAIACFHKALGLQPDYADVHGNLGNALADKGDYQGAIECQRRTIALRPNDAVAYNNLSHALCGGEKFEECEAAARQAIALRPDFPEAVLSLGNALGKLGRLDESATAFEHALALRPNYPDAHNNLGLALQAQGKLDRAIACYQTALIHRPEYPEAHTNLGMVLLLLGRLKEGWPEYEWRWQAKLDHRLGLRFPQPAWDGSPLHGKRIFLHPEQGLGDAIQFIRYVPQVAQRGGRITVACQRDLLKLFSTFPGVEQWVTHGAPVPEFDAHCSLLSLPRLLGTTLENIPAPIAYLKADPEQARQWRQRLAEETRLKVGLVWAGRHDHTNDRNRSTTLAELAGLRDAPGARYISLQKGRAAGQATSSPMEITDWTNELNDFADTAALVANLDLVITVDTAMAHLAGAMGKRTWLLLPFMPDWRWLLDRTDSPWYPTMRLFRQPRIGDWKTPIGQVVKEIRGLRTED